MGFGVRFITILLRISNQLVHKRLASKISLFQLKCRSVWGFNKTFYRGGSEADGLGL